jgi:hypothetical protein
VYIVELENSKILNQTNKSTEVGPPDDSEPSANIAQYDKLLTSDELLSFTSDNLHSFTSDELLSFTSDDLLSFTSEEELGSLAEDFLDFPSNENTLDNAEIQRVHDSAREPHGRDAASNRDSAHGTITLESRIPTARPDMEGGLWNLTFDGGQHQSEDKPPNTEKDSGTSVSTSSEQGTKPAKHYQDGTSKGRLTLSQ